MDDDNYVAHSTTKALHINALPCWHPSRHLMRVAEVPLFLKRLHNITCSYGAVLRWAREGIEAKGGGRIYLRIARFGRWRMVSKSDILKFLEQE